MALSPLISAGESLQALTQILAVIVRYAVNMTLAVIVALLLVRIAIDLFKLNPFGRVAYYARRPTDEIFYRMRQSQFYYPLKRALNFDPTILMVLVAVAILWYVTTNVVRDLFTVLSGLSAGLIALGSGQAFSGVRYLIGSLLLGAIFFLMALMTIVFVNWIFGLLRGAARWALNRIDPLLRIFEFGGAFAGWSFLILWIALTFAAVAVQAIFFQ